MKSNSPTKPTAKPRDPVATVSEDSREAGTVDIQAFVVGRQVADRFVINGHLGRGSSGEVLSVQDLSLDREVAMKVLRGAGGPTIARFMREARITARLDHPNVPPVHSLEFLPDGGLLFTMRKLDGMTLGEALRRTLAGEPPAAVAGVNAVVNLALRICDALSRAHFLGIIHRDVKPDNIVLGSHGEVALVDWGECRLVDEPDHGPAGSTVGTPAYMSPEQARGEAADQRSDIYGLAATMWHLLARQYPTWDDAPERFWEKKRQGIIDPLRGESVRRVPRPLHAILLRALAVRPQDRYASATTLAADLERFQAGQAVEAYREGWPERLARTVRRHRGLLLAAGAILLVIGIAAGLLWREQQRRVGAWGEPILSEDFLDESWRQRWLEAEPGTFRHTAGAVVSAGPYASYLLLKQSLSGAVAIEYEGRYEADVRPCDLSIIWSEDPDLLADPGRLNTGPKGRNYWIQAGAYDNHFCAMYRVPEGIRLDKSPTRIVPGRTHRFRVELDGRSIGMWMDGNPVLHHDDLLPIGSGHIGFYLYYPGKVISKVRVYQKRLPQETSVLALGDAFLDQGQPAVAAHKYRSVAESHPGSGLAAEALYRQGFISWQTGDLGEAMRIWSAIPSGSVPGDRVEAHRLEQRFAAGSIAEACRGLVELSRRQPEISSQLQSILIAWAIEAHRGNWVGHRFDDVQILLNAKLEGFLSEAGSDQEFGQLLLDCGRPAEALKLYPGELYVASEALIRLGRAQEAHDRFKDNMPVRVSTLTNMGDLAAVAADLSLSPELRVGPSWWSLTYSAPFPQDFTYLCRTGQAHQVVASEAFDPGQRHVALWLQGLSTPSLDLSQKAQIWSLDRLRMVTGMKPLNQASQFLGPEELGWALVESARQDDPTLLARARAQVASSVSDWHYWTCWLVVEPLVARDVQVLRQRLEQVWTEGKLNNAQRSWHLAGYVLGHVDAHAMRAQPCSREADLWISLGNCLRAELAGSAGAIRAAWSAYVELPRYRRLTPDMLPVPGFERLAAWRLGLP